jgi:hypothetical protein
MWVKRKKLRGESDDEEGVELEGPTCRAIQA